MGRRHLPEGLQKHRPYEHLTDSELNLLVEEAVEMRFRMAMLTPDEVAQTLIEHGMPYKAALEQVKLPGLRIFAAKFHLDVQDAAAGDQAAKDRVEMTVNMWIAQRRADRRRREEERERELEGASA